MGEQLVTCRNCVGSKCAGDPNAACVCEECVCDRCICDGCGEIFTASSTICDNATCTNCTVIEGPPASAATGESGQLRCVKCRCEECRCATCVKCKDLTPEERARRKSTHAQK